MPPNQLNDEKYNYLRNFGIKCGFTHDSRYGHCRSINFWVKNTRWYSGKLSGNEVHSGVRTRGREWRLGPRSGPAVGPEIRAGGWTRGPRLRSDPKSRVAVGPKVQLGGRTRGLEWRWDTRSGVAIGHEVRADDSRYGHCRSINFWVKNTR